MTAAGLLLLAFSLASGYLLHEIGFWRMWLREYPGHILYFRVLVVGLVWQSCWLALWQPPAGAFPGLEPMAQHAAALAAALALHIILYAALRVVFFLFPGTDARFYLRSFLNSGELLEYHTLRAMGDNLQIMVTLENSKVYIGIVESVHRRTGAKWLALLPLFSGYRNDERKLRLTTDYLDALAGGVLERREMLVTLPVEKITSLQFFDAGFHEYGNALGGAGGGD